MRCPFPFKQGKRRGMPRLLHHISARYQVFEVVPAFVPEADETRHRVIRRHAFRVDAENWV